MEARFKWQDSVTIPKEIWGIIQYNKRTDVSDEDKRKRMKEAGWSNKTIKEALK
jgi:hypothetical protein